MDKVRTSTGWKMNLSLDANEPFTNAIHTLQFAASPNPLTSNIMCYTDSQLPENGKGQAKAPSSRMSLPPAYAKMKLICSHEL